MSSKVCAANAKNLRAVFSCLLLSFAGHLALSADAAAADASPLAPAWHAQYGGPKTDFATATTISDGQAFTVGGSDGDASCFASPYYVPELNCSFSVRANALQDGTQAWVYKSRGTATQVATGKGKVFAVGQGVYGSGQTNFKVVALNQKTGQVVWHNESLPKGAIEGGAFMVAVAGDRVIVVGDVLNGTQFGQTQYFIRAYDIDSGNIVWEHKSAKTGYLGVFAYVAIADGKAVAVGEYNDNFITNAYDAENGTLLWSRQEDSGGGGYDAAKAVAIRDGRVFVAGEFSTEGGQSRDDYTHVYDLNTGDTIWVSQLDSGGFDFLDAITAGKDGLFVGGTGGPSCLFFSPGTCLLTMFSLDPVTGAVLWTDALDTTGIGQVLSIAASGGYVYMTGQGGPQCVDTCEVILRVYKAKTGKVVSTKFIDFHKADNTYPYLAVEDGYLVLVGSTQTKKGDYDWFINAYALETNLGDGK